jgi:D-alanyl-D-alanine carboxypeptidase (penicillin-binding protein 5/6)
VDGHRDPGVATRNLSRVWSRRVFPVLLALSLLAGWATPAAAAPGRPPPPLAGRGAQGEVVGGDRLAERGLVLPRGVPRLPADLTAHGWVLADLDTGEVLAARDPHARWQPASCQKILTALTLLPLLSDRRKLVVGTDDDVRVDGTRVGIVPRGHYSVDLLFQSLLMVSGNDAANALARAAGGVPRTIAWMNDEARTLQAFDTRAATPSGLDGPGQLTSAYDLALITRAAMRRPDFRRYVTQLRGRVPAQSTKYHAFDIANGNKLLYNYPGAIGVKNGFTDLARHTFVGAAQRGGRRLVVTFLRAEQRPVPVYMQASRLLDWGFALPRGSSTVGTLVDPVDPASMTPTPTATPSPAASPAAPMAASTSGPPHGFPLLPVAGGLAGGAVLIGALAAYLTRRRTWRTIRPH